MKYIKYFSVFLLLLVFSAPAFCAKKYKKKKPQTVYVMGVSYSFTDSVVYFTEIQQMDSVVFGGGDHNFLPSRQHYSYELSDYMAEKEGMPARVSALLYSKKQSKLQKKEANLKKKLLKKNMTVLYLGNRFSFTRP